MNPFSVLTSKIFGGLLVVGSVFWVVDEIGDNRVMNSAERTIARQNTDIANLKTSLTQARANAGSYKSGLAQCNSSLDAMAAQRSSMAQAGAAAVAQVRKAGERSVAAVARRVDAMPSNGSSPAQQCEQADAILLEGAAQ